MKKHHLLLFFLFLFISCSTHKKYGACELKETDETLSFPIDSDTKNNFNIYSVYKDKDGKEYFTFQNIENKGRKNNSTSSTSIRHIRKENVFL